MLSDRLAFISNRLKILKFSIFKREGWSYCLSPKWLVRLAGEW